MMMPVLSFCKTVHRWDYGRFVPMHFRSRQRNDHTVNVRSREQTCGRFVSGTKLPSNFHALERITECRKRVTYNVIN